MTIPKFYELFQPLLEVTHTLGGTSYLGFTGLSLGRTQEYRHRDNHSPYRATPASIALAAI